MLIGKWRERERGGRGGRGGRGIQQQNEITTKRNNGKIINGNESVSIWAECWARKLSSFSLRATHNLLFNNLITIHRWKEGRYCQNKNWLIQLYVAINTTPSIGAGDGENLQKNSWKIPTPLLPPLLLPIGKRSWKPSRIEMASILKRGRRNPQKNPNWYAGPNETAAVAGRGGARCGSRDARDVTWLLTRWTFGPILRGKRYSNGQLCYKRRSWKLPKGAHLQGSLKGSHPHALHLFRLFFFLSVCVSVPDHFILQSVSRSLPSHFLAISFIHLT